MVKKSRAVQPKSPQRDESGLTSRELREFIGWHPPKRKSRIYADMDVPKYLIDYARDKLKWDVFWVKESAKLTEQHDYFHFEKAKQLKRILLSFDESFLNVRRFRLHETGGVIVFSNPSKSRQDNLSILNRLHVLLRGALRRIPQGMKGTKIKVTTRGFTLTYLSENSQKISEFSPW